MRNELIRYLKGLLEYLEYYNRMSPFPIYDTEYVDEVRKGLKAMEDNIKNKYDELPVVACKYCNDLHVIVDEVENNICMRCGAVNELRFFDTIDDYLTYKDYLKNEDN